jgi:tRNA (guanine37-N1)-methyltransferase
LKVPEVLFSGNHKEIEKWRKEKTIEKTKEKRPDLYEKYLKEGGKDDS